jgi:chromate transporter
MGRKLAPDRHRATIAILAASAALIWPSVFIQLLLILAAGLIGVLFFKQTEDREAADITVPVGRSFAIVCLSVFFGLLILLPLLRQWIAADGLSLFDSFYRSGSLVFGGGHVVLPLLERETVSAGWIGNADFLAGYGAAQAVPGPLFTFAAYLGAMTGGITGAIIATAAIFLPAFLLVLGALPFWNALRRSPKAQGAFIGVNAAVVGLLLAALYDPLWTTAILTPADFALASILFVLLVFWKVPPWLVVLAGAAGGIIISGGM